MFAPAAWGWLADHSGAQRGIVLLSCASMIACFALLPLAQGVGSIAVIIAATGVFSSGALPLVEAITVGLPGGPGALWADPPVGIGRLRRGGARGRSLADLMPVTSLPQWLVAFALAALIAAIGLPRGARHPAPPPLRISIPPGARAVIAAGFCMALAHGTLYAFFTLHLQRLGYSGMAIGVMWTLGVIAEIRIFAFLPALFRRYSLSICLVASFLRRCAFRRDRLGGVAAVGAGRAQLLHARPSVRSTPPRPGEPPPSPQQAQARGQSIFFDLSYGAGGAAASLVAGWACEASGPARLFARRACRTGRRVFCVRPETNRSSGCPFPHEKDQSSSSTIPFGGASRPGRSETTQPGVVGVSASSGRWCVRRHEPGRGKGLFRDDRESEAERRARQGTRRRSSASRPSSAPDAADGDVPPGRARMEVGDARALPTK